jgi:hypothetical protein
VQIIIPEGSSVAFYRVGGKANGCLISHFLAYFLACVYTWDLRVGIFSKEAERVYRGSLTFADPGCRSSGAGSPEFRAITDQCAFYLFERTFAGYSLGIISSIWDLSGWAFAVCRFYFFCTP